MGRKKVVALSLGNHRGGATFDFTFCNFMFGLLLDNKSSASVAQAVVDLKRRLLAAGLSYAQLFTALLTDNGGEFADVFSFENNFHGEMESHLFFCDPYAPSQKPRVEKNDTILAGVMEMIEPRSLRNW